jgi:hypothetical protein
MCNENKIELALNKIASENNQNQRYNYYYFSDVLSLGIAHTLLGSH